jgi:hypothetical protein
MLHHVTKYLLDLSYCAIEKRIRIKVGVQVQLVIQEHSTLKLMLKSHTSANWGCYWIHWKDKIIIFSMVPVSCPIKSGVDQNYRNKSSFRNLSRCCDTIYFCPLAIYHVRAQYRCVQGSFHYIMYHCHHIRV